MRNSLLTGLLAAGATLILAGPAAAQDLVVKTSGLDFGRDITLRPGNAPVQMDVRAGETFTVTASASQPDRRVGLIGFREMMSASLTDIEGIEFFDLEDDVGAFTVALPRIRVIPIERFDPWSLLG